MRVNLIVRLFVLKLRSSRRIDDCFILMVLLGIAGNVSSSSPSLQLFPQPSFAEPIPNVTVSAGRDISLPCVIENVGSYRVAWSHKDKSTLISIQSRVIMRNSKYTVSHQNYRVWYLHLNKVDATDSGNYMCQINTTPMISQTGYMNVVVAPSIVEDETNSDTNVREGNDVSLKCSASGSPKPNIKWRREDDGEILLDNGKVHDISDTFLNLTKVSRLSMGAYLCIAANGIPPSVSKRIMLNVKFPPMIWIPNQLVGVAIGNEVTIDCHLESFPEPVTYWTKGPNGVVVISGENIDSVVMRSGMYKIQMRLSIRSMVPEYYGSYTCVAKNSLGETEGKIRLYEIAQTTTYAGMFRERIDSKYESGENSFASKISEFETISPVSSNNWNSQGFNTVWKNPSEKGSIDTGERNGVSSFAKSIFLQISVCAVLHVLSRIIG